jgi:hypothetical protein
VITWLEARQEISLHSFHWSWSRKHESRRRTQLDEVQDMLESDPRQKDLRKHQTWDDDNNSITRDTDRILFTKFFPNSSCVSTKWSLFVMGLDFVTEKVEEYQLQTKRLRRFEILSFWFSLINTWIMKARMSSNLIELLVYYLSMTDSLKLTWLSIERSRYESNVKIVPKIIEQLQGQKKVMQSVYFSIILQQHLTATVKSSD